MLQENEIVKGISCLMDKNAECYYGIYRGIVTDNSDPDKKRRIKVSLPCVWGDEPENDRWVELCTPYGGTMNQGFLFIPDAGAGVWIMFEQGNPDCPVCVGGWPNPVGENELPKPNNADGSEQESVQDPPTRKIIKTQTGSIQFEDGNGKEMVIIVQAANGHVVTLDKDGIKISDGVNGNQIIMGASGIQVGSENATEPFILGNQFMAYINAFIIALNTHTHIGNLGYPTLPPMAPMQLPVPLSAKHKVE